MQPALRRSISRRWFVLRVWDDGWWCRLGAYRFGISYINISQRGYNPLVSERYGLDRTIQLRVGPHVWKLLRSCRRRERR